MLVVFIVARVVTATSHARTFTRDIITVVHARASGEIVAARRRGGVNCDAPRAREIRCASEPPISATVPSSRRARWRRARVTTRNLFARRSSRERTARTTRGRRARTTTRAGLTTFPSDYAAMERQCRRALKAAVGDGVELCELQFPPGGLDLAPGDLEGNVECNLTTERLRGLSRLRRVGVEKTTRVLFRIPPRCDWP